MVFTDSVRPFWQHVWYYGLNNAVYNRWNAHLPYWVTHMIHVRILVSERNHE